MSTKSEFIQSITRKKVTFLRNLKTNNYKPTTIAIHRRIIDNFIQIINQSMAFLQTPTVSELKEYIPAAIVKHGEHRHTYARTILNAFIKYLSTSKVLRKTDKVCNKSIDVRKDRNKTLKHFASYLSDFRGLSVSTIKGYRNEFSRLLDNKFGDAKSDLNKITRDDVINHLVLIVQKGPRNRTHKAVLTNICNYLLWAGHTNEHWAKTIPKQKTPPTRAIPRYLPPEQIEEILNAVKSHPNLGIRNFAMCILMARLGLRAQEVVAIKLKDIDWRNGKITIRGKGNYHDDMPLSVDLRDAIISYIQNIRQGNSRHLFVSSRPPYKRFKNGAVLNDILMEACRKAEICLPQRYIGSHVFRHSAATDLLAKGASLETVSDFLRHRSRASTQIYAKHDLNSLRGLCPEWPQKRARS